MGQREEGKNYADFVAETLFGKDFNFDYFKTKLFVVVLVQAIFFGVWFLDGIFGGVIMAWGGIRPRQLGSLPAILVAPFLHTSFGHLIVNVLPFMLLASYVVMRKDGLYVIAHLSVLDAVAGGLFVWTAARPDTVHVGSSGLVFAFWGYIIACTYYTQDFRKAMISTAMFIGYILVFMLCFPMTPEEEKVSWESHAIGVIVGLVFGQVDASYWHSRGEDGDDKERQGLIEGAEEDDEIDSDF